MTLTVIYWIFVVISVLSTLSVIAIVVSENRNPVKSLAWVTVLLLLPVVGLLLYVFFGRNIKNKHIVSRRNRKLLRRIEEHQQRPAYDLSRLSPQARQHIHMTSTLVSAPFYTGNDATIYSTGKEKFDALMADIKGAKKYVHIQYYIFDNDATGRELQQLLIAKAREGVKVRVIYDHVGSFATPNRFFREMIEAGVEAHPFFRVTFPQLGTRINWRNHRKLCVIDGSIGYIGGMNVADRYIHGMKGRAWRDNHIRITGPAVASLQRSFAIDWAFMGQPLLTESVDSPASEANMGMQLVTSGPTSQWSNIALVYQRAIASARRRVYIQTPYFLPTESLLKALQSTALAGVDVRVMIPRRSDSEMLRLASYSYVAECLKAGIKIYLYEPGMLHSKVMIIDDDIVSVGSTNFDARSFEHNFEASMMVYSSQFNAQMRRVFHADQAQSTRINAADWRRRPMMERALSSVFRLFSPIL